jgi:Fur family transcriptional regulator, ferric uptake regulator
MAVTEILKKAQLRITNTRVEVLNLFQQSKHAITPADVEEKMENPDRITVYRTLKSFEEKGIIHKVVDGTGISKYALCDVVCVHQEQHHHHNHVHFHCNDCGNTFCIENVDVPEINIPGKYAVKDKNVILSGSCEMCSA